MMKKVAIIGTGQQGTSIAKGLSASGAYDVATFDSSEDIRTRFNLETQEYRHIANFNNIEEAVRDADIIMLAVPIDKFPDVLDQLNGKTKANVIITDVGSGKQRAVQSMKEHAPEDARVIGGHGIEGAEGVGPETSKEDMFQGASAVIVPNPHEPDAQHEVESLWMDIGAKITYMSPFAHDMFYGTISHFQHPLAFALTASGQDTLQINKPCEDYELAGNTVLDTTRISKASVPMWTAIFKDNNASVLKAAQGFEHHFSVLKAALEADRPDALKAELHKAHHFRSQIPDRPRESILAEAADIAEEKGFDRDLAHNPDSLAQKFDKAALTSLAKRATTPVLISAALTLNAMDVESELSGVSIIESANPSFKDGSAAMLTDPDYLADLLYYNKDELLQGLESFESEYQTIMTAIRDQDMRAVQFYIEKVSAIRTKMPDHKTPEQMRDEYVINDEPDSFAEHG